MLGGASAGVNAQAIAATLRHHLHRAARVTKSGIPPCIGVAGFSLILRARLNRLSPLIFQCFY
jgi:hypothetical protein